MSNTGTIEVYRDINIDSDSGSDSELAMINGNETETSKIGRAHVRTPVTEKSRMPSSA